MLDVHNAMITLIYKIVNDEKIEIMLNILQICVDVCNFRNVCDAPDV